MKFYELAELSYRAVLDKEPNFDVARDRLNAVVCEQKLNLALLANERYENDLLCKLNVISKRFIYRKTIPFLYFTYRFLLLQLVERCHNVID